MDESKPIDKDETKILRTLQDLDEGILAADLEGVVKGTLTIAKAQERIDYYVKRDYWGLDYFQEKLDKLKEGYE